MSSHRSSRLAGEIKKEISQLIRDDVKDPRIGFVTVTDVEVSGDMRHAKVYLSVMGDKTEKSESLLCLERAGGFLRSELAKRIKSRYMPELNFKLDESLDYSSKINAILSKVKEE